jgi:C1A family cysteine protease
MPTKEKSTSGGHAVLLVDYFKSPIESQSSYFVKNSWGTKFADSGMCRIEASLFKALYEVYSPHPLLD